MPHRSNTIRKNLETRGFLCDTPQFGAIEPWLRLNPAFCFSIAVAGMYFESAIIFFILSVWAAAGAFFPHAPGDIVYNYGIRFFIKTPPLPKNPPPRRFACFVGMVWSIAIALAFIYGYALAANILGVILLLVIIPMIVWHYCIASVIFQKIFRS